MVANVAAGAEQVIAAENEKDRRAQELEELQERAAGEILGEEEL